MPRFLFLSLIILINFSSFCYAVESIQNPKTSQKQASEVFFKRGIQEYSNGKFKDAIASWKQVLDFAKKENNTTLQISITTNIGAAYNALGYHKTALFYFLDVDRELFKQKTKQENYWINHVNIAACYMSLEQDSLAKKYFDNTKEFNDHVTFLKYVNVARYHAERGDRELFSIYESKIDSLIARNPVYKKFWSEIQLEFYTKWEDLSRLRKLLKNIEPDYQGDNLPFKIAFNKAYFLGYQKFYEPIEKLLVYKDEVEEGNNFYLKELYYTLLQNYYLDSNNLQKYSYYTKKSHKALTELYQEKNMLYVEDYRAAQKLDVLKNKYEASLLSNEVVKGKLATSKQLFRVSCLLIALALIVLFLLYRNYLKSKEVNALLKLQTQLIAQQNELEKRNLTTNLKLTEEELFNSVANIKKILLLKKKLDDIIQDNIKQSDNDAIRQIKVSLNSFFDTYRELSHIINKEVNIEGVISKLKLQFPDINKKEYEVIEHILLQFTTKEIALLLGKTEKGVEYNRTQIRRKLHLDPDCSLEQFFNSQK